MKKITFSLVIIYQILLLNSCMRHRAPITFPKRIALLPTINQTTDVLGGLVFRYMLYEALEEYNQTNFIPVMDVDTLLNEEGITDGGQLVAIENKELFQILDADGLFFVELESCDYKTIGISETRRVGARFTLIRIPSDTLWRFEYEIDEGKSVFDTFFQILADPKEAAKKTLDDFGEQVAIKGARMWILDHPLKPEMESVIKEAIDSLP